MKEHKHEFTIITRTWQTVNYVRYQILNHSEQVAICSCGEIINPWQEKKSDDK